VIAVRSQRDEIGRVPRTTLGDRREVTRALCACLLLLAIPRVTSADDEKPLTTILLIARAGLPDPNFKDSIVLVMNNIGPAPVGVIINRPTRIEVSQLFPDVERLAQLHDKLYFGGPVAITSVSFLYRADTQDEHAARVLDGVYFSANRELLEKLLGRDKPMDGLRIFIGRSGWAPGQLEGEIARGDWTLTPAGSGAIFDRKSEHPWPERESADTGDRI
jgi:putative transcriptional regulator